jgi:D-alanine--poly(phosphoribitol) ligase subunit 1
MENNLLEYFDNTTRLFPNKIAVDDNKLSISFSELDNFSDKIALEIHSKTNNCKQPIAVYLPKSSWSIVSFIGVFKSGNFYIPLDIKSPGSRILNIIETLDSSYIITNFEQKDNLIQLGYKGNVICIEDAIHNDTSHDDITKLKRISNSIIDLDPVYSIFTSGSTGVPKGVLISHKGVIDFIQWAIHTYKITEKAIIGNQVPLHFDMSVLDMYLMIFAGATLHIIPEDQFTFPIKLMEYVNDKEINFIFWVPSVLNNISNFDTFSTIKPTSLSKILFAGEAMPNKHLNYWRKNYPNALYSNLYGPTEITVIATYYILNRTFKDDESLPIGKACKNVQTQIITNEGELVKKGHIGELIIRGSLVASGYYNNNEKTKEAFVQNPLHNSYPDIVYKTGDLVYENDLNEMIFVGRKDSQIKHLGYRIELGEIETAILGIEGVGNSCVIYDEQQKIIVAFVSSKKAGVVIRKELLHNIPKYMIPTKWIHLDQFPLNPNGKMDRKELKNILEGKAYSYDRKIS